MQTMTKTILTAAALAATGSLAASASAQTVVSGGHWDVELAYEDGSWDPHFHLHDTETEIEFDEVEILGNFDSDTAFDTPTPRPAGSQWDFTGAAAGEDLYIWTASDPQPELTFLGTAAEEVELGVFVDDVVNMKFEGIVSGPAGGSFSKYGFNGSGGLEVHFASEGTGFTLDDQTLGINVTSHQHFNWAFTELGTYELAFSANGELVADGTTTSSDTFVVTFTVVPEPASLGLLGLGGLALMRRRR